MYIHLSIEMYWPGLFSEKCIILTMTVFVRSQSFISLPSFMFVSAEVICESNWNKEKEKSLQNGYFTPFLGIIDPFFTSVI